MSMVISVLGIFSTNVLPLGADGSAPVRKTAHRQTMTDTTTLRTLKRTSTLWIILVVGLALLAGGCAQQPRLKRFQYAQIKMGVQARLVVYAPDEPTAERACTAAY